MNSRKANTNQILVVLIAVLFAVISLCCCSIQATRLWPSPNKMSQNGETIEESTLTIGYSPEKEETFTRLVSAFNAQTESGDQVLAIEAVRYEPDLMVEAALAGRLQAISPDSSVWLDTLDREWKERTGREAPLVGQTERYAVSPIVIAMWEDVARSMGYPDRPLGWADLLARAQSDPAFKWSHPSTNSAAGLLATLA